MSHINTVVCTMGKWNNRKRTFTISILVTLLAAGFTFQLPSSLGFVRVAALPLNYNECCIQSAVLDAAGGFAYFGALNMTAPGGWSSEIVKVRLSDFARVGALALNSADGIPNTAVIDVANGFAYFGTNTVPGNSVPGTIVKIRLSNFTRVGALMLNPGENTIASSVIDPVAGFAYFGTYTNPGRVVKIRLSNFTRAGALTLDTGENRSISAAIDLVGGFAYFGTATDPGIVVKVRLSNLTRAGALTFNSGEPSVDDAIVDSVGGFAYFGTGSVPGVVLKVRLSDFTRVGTLKLNSGDYWLSSALLDVAGGFAYFGTWSGGKVVKIRLSDFTEQGDLTLNSGENYVGAHAAVIDTLHGFAYFGTYPFSYSIPTAVVRLQFASVPSTPTSLTATSRTGQISLNWTAPTINGDRNLTGYKIYRSTASGSETFLSTIGNQTSFTDNQVSSSEAYYYEVTALNNFGESRLSNEASATPTSPNVTPATPLTPSMILLTTLLASISLALLTLKRR